MRSFFRRFTKRILIISNIVIAVLYILAAVTPYVEPGSYWMLSVLTTGFPLLLLLLLLFFIFWLIVKPRWGFVSLIALLTGWKTMLQTVAVNFSGNKSEAAGAFKIMSWNVHMFNYYYNKKNPAVKEKMFALVRNQKPAIACFQEFAYTMPYKDSSYSLETLQQQLSMPYSFIQSHPLDSAALKEVPLHFGKAIYSAYPIINKQHVFNNKGSYNFSFMYADIALPDDTVRVFNVHLQSLYFSNREYEFVENITDNNNNIEDESKNVLRKIKRGFYKRGEQAKIIREYLDKSPYPVILCGDFNDVPGSFAYNTVKGGLQDAFIEKGRGLGRTFNRLSPTLRIDNIFVDKRYNVEGYKRISSSLSDHFPITALLKKEETK